MHTAFSFNVYTLKPQGLSLGGGKFRASSPDDQVVLYSEQKDRWSMPFTTIHIYADDKKKQELLRITETDAGSAANTYEVMDVPAGQVLGMLAGDWSGWFTDAWSIIDPAGGPLASIQEKSTGRAILHNLMDGIVPQILNIFTGELQLGELRQKNIMIGHLLIADFSMDSGKLDRRLGLAAAFLVAGHQRVESD